MANAKVDTASDWGEIISVDDQKKGPRGQKKQYENGLLLLLGGLVLDSEACVVMHPDYCVPRSNFPATVDGKEACKNARQALGARLKTHHEELVRRGDLPEGTRLSINWHPSDGSARADRPQCSLKRLPVKA